MKPIAFDPESDAPRRFVLTRQMGGRFSQLTSERLIEGVSVKVKGKRLFLALDGWERGDNPFVEELVIDFRIVSDDPGVPEDLAPDDEEVETRGEASVSPKGKAGSGVGAPRHTFVLNAELSLEENFKELERFMETQWEADEPCEG